MVEIHDRAELDLWLGEHPPVTYTPVLMLVRGDSTRIRELLPNVLDAAKLDEHRVVLWVRDQNHLDDDELQTLFLGDEEVVAAVLGPGGEPASWLYADHIDVEDAVYAFDAAMASTP
jgi:hypothetical protein